MLERELVLEWELALTSLSNLRFLMLFGCHLQLR